jgi:hypothetical protein
MQDEHSGTDQFQRIDKGTKSVVLVKDEHSEETNCLLLATRVVRYKSRAITSEIKSVNMSS